jgi:hypothetical protein
MSERKRNDHAGEKVERSNVLPFPATSWRW